VDKPKLSVENSKKFCGNTVELVGKICNKNKKYNFRSFFSSQEFVIIYSSPSHGGTNMLKLG
jgi:hypothetical protein